MSDVPLTLTEQEELFKMHWLDAWDRVLERLHDGRQQIATMAFGRLRTGFEEFGASMFLDDSVDSLKRDVDEELADAINYEVGMIWHEQNMP